MPLLPCLPISTFLAFQAFRTGWYKARSSPPPALPAGRRLPLSTHGGPGCPLHPRAPPRSTLDGQSPHPLAGLGAATTWYAPACLTVPRASPTRLRRPGTPTSTPRPRDGQQHKRSPAPSGAARLSWSWTPRPSPSIDGLMIAMGRTRAAAYEPPNPRFGILKPHQCRNPIGRPSVLRRAAT